MTIKSNAASVRFKNATKAYGEVIAVDRVSLTIEPGELTTLLGPSGCGKTTTLRLIAGLEMANSGQIFIGEQDVTKLPATDRDVAMVFQSYALFPHMTVGENVAYGLKVSGVRKAEARTRSQDALNLVGLADLGARMPSELSGGQQQRVAVARALVLEPQVLLFDEPLSNLDAKLRRRVREEIREIQQNLGLTVVYVTHDQEEALAVSDRIVVMKNAVIAQIGTPRELYEAPSDAFVADFIGEANILDCQIISVTGGIAQVRLGDIVMQLPALDLGPGPAQLAIRPRRISLHAEPLADTTPGTLLKATYVGTHVEYRIDTAHGEIFAISDDVDALHDTGSEIRVGFKDPGPVLIPAG
jgi:iron(III) transport system ATP-binding protein